MLQAVYSLLLFCVAKSIQLPYVKIPEGTLQGRFSTTYNGRSIIEFVGIPFAQPPVGKLRFEEPRPVQPWQGVWIANTSTICSQIAHWPKPEGGVSAGTEDCLHLDVIIPTNDINNTANYDVIVHIHGGAFMFGSKDVYAGPKYLLDRDIILVRINYRVGIFGFLSTLDENLPGNLGMKDQVLALQWVKNNIRFFGGNSDSITITGLSAGGASVHYHYLSPLSKGLFNRGISVSGCALNAWTIQEDALKKAIAIGKEVGCSFKNTKELKECLKTRNGEQLNEATRILRPWLFAPFSPLALVVDKSSERPFLPEHPYKLLLDRKVNDVQWIVSAATSEGLYPVADLIVDQPYLINLEKRWEELAPHLLHYSETVPEYLHSDVSQQIKKRYLGNRPINNSTFKDLIQMAGDRLFVYDIEISARLQSQAVKSPVYIYQFNYTGEEVPSLVPIFTGLTEKFGVSHGDDMMFMFSNSLSSDLTQMTESDVNMKNLLLEIWTNYSKTGTPGVHNWVPVSKNEDDLLNYLYIGSPHDLEMRITQELGHKSFWLSMPFAENANLFNKFSKTEL